MNKLFIFSIVLLNTLSFAGISRAVFMVDETKVPVDVRAPVREAGEIESADFFIQATTTAPDNVADAATSTTSAEVGATAWEGSLFSLPPETTSWIEDVLSLFKRAVVILGEIVSQVVQDVLNAFRPRA